MNKILVNEKEYNFIDNNLPILIHGEDKSGASLYTMSLAANLYSQGSKLLFLCGYKQAQEEFVKQVGSSNQNANFLTKERAGNFKTLLAESTDRIIFIKNIELFSDDIFDLVKENERLIISGDINQCSFKKKILEKSFTTKIFFTQLNGFDVPELQKYKGFLKSENLQGLTSLEIH
ncbi:MAG: hypothetical protein AAB345_01890 [Patescibacteria group bacterium]